MKNEKFPELLKLLSLANIQIIDSHETVFQNVEIKDSQQVEIQTQQGFHKDDPQIGDKKVEFHPKYTFTFSVEDEKYFCAEYILLVTFTLKNKKRFSELFADEEVKKIFLEKQLNRTLWSILRGTVMDAFNRHSLKPITLPWII